jgi:NAD(P)H-dependent flavin oxidoreductase YrpB (nitropropane dioxygenase family)
MIRTRLSEVLNIEHPIGLGGMASIQATDLVAAACEAGALGAFGASLVTPDEIRDVVAKIRAKTDKPFGLNFLMFMDVEERFATALALKPAVMAFAWPRPDQDLTPWFERAHDAGCKITFMVNNLADAERGAEAGADVIIAQGTEGGGHVSWMATSVLTPMVVDAVAPIPVMAAGGIADGRGLAMALALGAEGALLGTRFLATAESPLHDNFKQAILDSDGHDTMLTEIPDVAAGAYWPGAMARVRRNRFIERWAGQEWRLRQNRAEAFAGVQEARKTGNADEAPLLIGQDAGLISDLPAIGELIARMVAEAEGILSKRLPGLVR